MADISIDYLLGGGSHLAKISAVLEWLEASNDAGDDDLVVMMDAYGQLRSNGADHYPMSLTLLQTFGSSSGAKFSSHGTILSTTLRMNVYGKD
jgi:hypothetical protein